MKFHDIEVGFDAEPELGLADNGDLETDLSTLLEQVGKAASAAKSVVVLLIDELQDLPELQFGALIAALHRCAQDRLPVTVVGAGLPQLRACRRREGVCRTAFRFHNDRCPQTTRSSSGD